MVKLGVNIDHVATLRQARRVNFPDPVQAAAACELAGADGITVHLREDRRHIQDRDVIQLRQSVKTKLNLEMSVSEAIVKVALDVVPDETCLVPEKREELTTEGGLDVASQKKKVAEVVSRLKSKGIIVSLFIDPDEKQMKAAREVNADCVELHTGAYASLTGDSKNKELLKIQNAAKAAVELGLILNAGHGLDYQNVGPIAKISKMNTLNIGFSIVSRAIFVGLTQAVREMKELINKDYND